MASIAQSLPASSPAPGWLWEWLRNELSPYPGRTLLVARMVIAATLVMTLCMTHRIPYAFQGAIYALIVSRENTRATLQSAGIILLFTGIGAAYVLISMAFVVSLPIPAFLLGHWFVISGLLYDQHDNELRCRLYVRNYDLRRSSDMGPPCLFRDQRGGYALVVFGSFDRSRGYGSRGTGVCATTARR